MENKFMSKAVAIVGSSKKLSEALKVHPSLITNFVKGRKAIPLQRCLQIERLTGGKVKREELNPAINWAELRSLMNE